MDLYQTSLKIWTDSALHYSLWSLSDVLSSRHLCFLHIVYQFHHTGFLIYLNPTVW